MSSKISLWWHMIVRGHVEETTLALNSLQGLCDGIVVAVDDREDSNEVFFTMINYPNMYAYRQHFDDFGRYDLARQDALNRVPDTVDYVGWSDSDEVLVTDPYEVRKWLNETQPEAVNCGIHYVYPIGGHNAGETYRNGRVRIWKHGTRVWSRPCHEYPTPINGVDNPVIGDIIFNHIKEDPTEYRSDHHIKLMQEEIDKGNIGWKFFQAKEYEIKGDIENARLAYFDYLKSDDSRHFDEAISKMSESYLSSQDYDLLIINLRKLGGKDNPLVFEYLAIASYWKGAKSDAFEFHKNAQELDVNHLYPWINQNDIHFIKEIRK